ncbi:hypothetical protein [Dorea sp. D27]|nr:hypothetical protein [Dorea sp. D27]
MIIRMAEEKDALLLLQIYLGTVIRTEDIDREILEVIWRRQRWTD